MLQGYAIAEDEINIELYTFRDQFFPDGIVESVVTSIPAITSLKHIPSRGKLNFTASIEHRQEESIYIFFAEEKSIGIKSMRRCVLFAYR